MRDELVIRPYQAGDSIERLTEILHDAYGALLRMGFRYFATHQTPADTKQRLERGWALVAELNGELVGTATLYRHEVGHPCQTYAIPGVFHFGQFAVRPDLQGRGYGNRLLEAIEQLATEHGAVALACDTATGATHLIDYYGRHGYFEVARIQWDVTNYESVILSKKL